MCFKKKNIYSDPVEERFDAVMSLIKDLDKGNYQRLKEAMDLGWQSYQKIRRVATPEERAEAKLAKESNDIDTIEKVLEKE